MRLSSWKECPSQLATCQPNARNRSSSSPERDDLVRRLVRLQLVAIDDDRQPGKPLVGGALQALVVLPLLELPVADHDDDASAPTEVSLRPRDPATLRDPHAERAGVRLDARNTHVGVAVEPAELAQPEQPLGGNHAERVQRRVETGDVVALRGEVHVAIRRAPTDRGRVQLLEQEERDDVHRTEGRAEVARACPLHGDERIETAHVREEREPVVGRQLGPADPIELGLRSQGQVAHGRGRYRGRCGVTTSERSSSARSSSVFSHRKRASLEPRR